MRCFARVLQRQREWDATAIRRDFDQPARFFESLHVFTRYAFDTAGNAAVTTTCQGIVSIAPNQAAASVDAVARWDRDPGSHRRAKTPGSGARLRSFGVVVGVAIA